VLAAYLPENLSFQILLAIGISPQFLYPMDSCPRVHQLRDGSAHQRFACRIHDLQGEQGQRSECSWNCLPALFLSTVAEFPVSPYDSLPFTLQYFQN
jgi:hypothetical protein